MSLAREDDLFSFSSSLCEPVDFEVTTAGSEGFGTLRGSASAGYFRSYHGNVR